MKKPRGIRMLLLDVDGILTDGRIFRIAGHWSRHFHLRDGYGIKRLLRAGVQVAILSGSDSDDIRVRMKELGVSLLWLGSDDKLQVFEQILATTGVPADAIAYMGDDLFDLPVLERVGFSATVRDAHPLVKRSVDYVTALPGGWGAVREVADLINRQGNRDEKQTF